MNRRTLLRVGAAIPAAALLGGALAACATGTTDPFASVATDVSDIAGAFTGAAPSLSGVQGISASTLSDITTAGATLQAIAADLAMVDTQASAQPLVTRVVADAGVVLNELDGNAALPASVQQILTAVQTMLPVIELAVGIALTAGKKTGMSVAPARHAESRRAPLIR
jgi:hypothetical protein